MQFVKVYSSFQIIKMAHKASLALASLPPSKHSHQDAGIFLITCFLNLSDRLTLFNLEIYFGMLYNPASKMFSKTTEHYIY